MNFKVICRICLKKNSEMKSIFGLYKFSAHQGDIYKIIEDCASVQVQRFDGFSEQICQRCLNHLSQAYSFKKLCEDSDYKFRNGLIVNDDIIIKSEYLVEDPMINYDAVDDNTKEYTREYSKLTDVGLPQVKKEEFVDEITENKSDKENPLRFTNETIRCPPSWLKHTQYAESDGWLSNYKFKRNNLIESNEIQTKSEFIIEEDTAINYGVIDVNTKESTENNIKRDVADLGSKEFEKESESDSENERSGTPPHIYEQAASTSSSLIPQKSKVRYEVTYKKFMDWRAKNNVQSFSENVLMAYFGEISKQFKPSSLWSTYSMLKNMLSTNDIYIGKYPKLKAYLKKQSDGFKSNKSKTLTPSEVNKFIKEAPDRKYLLLKTVLIIGICAGCRKKDLRNLKITDVEDNGEEILIKIPNPKKKVQKPFVVSGNFYKVCKQYMEIRRKVKDPSMTQLFLNYQSGQCTIQAVGVNKLGSMPKEIAEYLKLPDPGKYTGHCFKRISAKML